MRFICLFPVRRRNRNSARSRLILDVIRRLPDELTVAELAGKVEVLGETERIAANTGVELREDFIKAFGFALAASINAAQFRHCLLN